MRRRGRSGAGQDYEQRLAPKLDHPERPEEAQIQSAALVVRDPPKPAARRAAEVTIQLRLQPKIRGLLAGASQVVGGELARILRKQATDGLEGRDVRQLSALVDALRKLGQEERDSRAAAMDDVIDLTDDELLAAAGPLDSGEPKPD